MYQLRGWASSLVILVLLSVQVNSLMPCREMDCGGVRASKQKASQGDDNGSICNPGLFGRDCQNICPNNCLRCRSLEICTECIVGVHGVRCEQQCPENCISCYSETATPGIVCTKCVNELHGPACNCQLPCLACDSSGHCSECPKGSYGANCEWLCSIGCQDNICDTYSGNCTKGCKSNYAGIPCQSCATGRYGERCQRECPKACHGQICNKATGLCEKCEHGRYGPQCMSNCSQTCANLICDIDTGECTLGCVNGFSGTQCNAPIGSDEVRLGFYISIGVCVALVTAVVIAVVISCSREQRLTRSMRLMQNQMDRLKNQTSQVSARVTSRVRSFIYSDQGDYVEPRTYATVSERVSNLQPIYENHHLPHGNSRPGHFNPTR